jgi:predicted nucleic acid-binding protein
VLIDTDVLIWMMRGHRGAAYRLEGLKPWKISAVTYIELAQGCRNKQELHQLKHGMGMCRTDILPITMGISGHAIHLIESWSLSHHLQLGDALIAATALEHDLPVLTGNTKHFTPIPGLRVEVFRP